MQVREIGDIFGPAHRGEEQSRGDFVDALGAHHVSGIEGVAVRGRVGLRSEQEGDVGGEVRVPVQGLVAVGDKLARDAHGLAHGDSAPLHS